MHLGHLESENVILEESLTSLVANLSRDVKISFGCKLPIK